MESGNPYVMALIPQIALIVTPLFTLIGVIIQVRSNSKARKNEDLVKVIDGKTAKKQTKKSTKKEVGEK